MTALKILTSGVDSEYVLADLCSYLRDRGLDVVELDFGQYKGNAYDVLNALKGSKVVYITSAHTNVTIPIARYLVPKFAENYPNYLAPVEIIPFINPCASIYIPHDLLTPYGDSNLNEYRFLDLFDYILSPWPDHALQAAMNPTTKVVYAGWIKHAKERHETKISAETPTRNQAPRVALFVSMLEYLRWKYGVEGLLKYYLPLLQNNVTVKFPAWHGVDTLENLFDKNSPAQVFPATGSTAELILNSDVVICNGASSIHAEANLLGKPSICLLDDEGISSKEQEKKLGHLPSVYFHNYKERSPVENKTIQAIVNANKLTKGMPFDYGFVYKIIETFA